MVVEDAQPDRTANQAHAAELPEEIRRHGGRNTGQRRAVWEVLARASEHLSASVVHECVCMTVPTIALSTVYRTLALLEKRGLIHAVATGSQVKYGVVEHGQLHHHLVCSGCASLYDVPVVAMADFAAAIEASTGLRLDSRLGVPLRGLCSKCR